MKFQAVLAGHSTAKFEGDIPPWGDKKTLHYRVTCKCGTQFSSGKAGDADEDSPENRGAWRLWHQHVIWKLLEISLKDVGTKNEVTDAAS